MILELLLSAHAEETSGHGATRADSIDSPIQPLRFVELSPEARKTTLHKATKRIKIAGGPHRAAHLLRFAWDAANENLRVLRSCLCMSRSQWLDKERAKHPIVHLHENEECPCSRC